MTTTTDNGKILLSHTVLPDGFNNLEQWGNSFLHWEDQQRREFEHWLNNLLYTNNEKAYN